MRIATTAAVLLSAIVVNAAAAQEPAKKLSPLEGTWIIDTINGQPTPAERGELALIVTGGKYEQRQSGQVIERGDIAVTVSKTSVDLAFTIASGQLTGKTQLGHCQVAPKAMTCKLASPGDPHAPIDVTPEQGRFQFTAKKR